MTRMSVLWIAFFFVASAHGCGPDRPADSTDVDASIRADLGPEVGAADSDGPELTGSDTVTDTAPGSAPVFEVLTVAQSAKIGLVAWLNIATDVPTQLTVTLEDLATGLTTPIPTTGALAKKHAPVVMDLRAERAYRIHIDAFDTDGMTVSGALDFETAPLPAFFAGLDVSISDGERMQPGYTLVSAKDDSGLVTFALNAAREVVFYNTVSTSFVVPTPAGNYLAAMEHGGPIYTSTLLGKSGATIDPMAYGTLLFHHLPGISPEGNYLTLGVELRSIEGYPVEGGGTATYQVVGDIFYELTPAGELVNKVQLFDVLDPYRVGWCFDCPFWAMDFPGLPGGPKDWSHSNSLTIDPDDGNYVASVLNQNWVVKLRRDTGALIWRLGPEGDFQLAPGGRWSGRHHGVSPQQGDRILLYDNDPASPPLFSRAVEYSLDTADWVATQTWEYQVDPPGMTDPLGEVHRLDNGNVLICEAALWEVLEDQGSPTWGRVVEVTYPAPSEEVFRMTLKRPDGETNFYEIFSARRIPSLY
ncbi:MAG: aryl-sulfate sulfotransferase [Pseudomonadota bacterium]